MTVPFHLNGHFYQGVGVRNPDRTRFAHRLYRLEGSSWELEAEAVFPKGRNILRLLPCGKDSYLGIAGEDPRDGISASDRSPFILYHRSEGKQLAPFKGLDPGHKALARNGRSFARASEGKLIITEPFATLMDADSGLYWVFDLDKGQLAHSGRLYTKVTDELLKADKVHKAVLGLQPTIEGEVLIMARLEEVVAEGRPGPLHQAQAYLAQPGAEVDHGLRLAAEGQRQVVDRNPIVRWFRLDPAKGSLKALPAPPPGGIEILDPEKGHDWRPLPDGSVRMGVVEPKEAAPKPAR